MERIREIIDELKTRRDWESPAEVESRFDEIAEECDKLEGYIGLLSDGNGYAYIDGEIFTATDAKVKTHHPGSGEYVLSNFYKVAKDG